MEPVAAIQKPVGEETGVFVQLAGTHVGPSKTQSVDEPEKIYSQTVQLLSHTLNFREGFNVTADGETAIVDDAKFATVSLTANDIKALKTSPKELVAAPAAGMAIELVSVQLFLDYGAAAYVAGAGNLCVGKQGKVAAQTFLEATADAGFFIPNNGGALEAATALTLSFDGGGNPTTGDSTMKAKVKYRIVPLAL